MSEIELNQYDDFTFDPELAFTPPELVSNAAVNWCVFKPTRASFVPGDTFEIRVESDTSFARFSDAFIKGTFVQTLAANSNGSTGGSVALNSIGVASAFSTVQENVGGYTFPQLGNLPIVYKIDFDTDSPDRRLANYKASRYIYNTSDPATAVVSKSGSDVINIPFVIPLKSQLCSSKSPIPLADITGGVDIFFTLSNATDVLFSSGGAAQSSYTLNDIQLVVPMVSPTSEYMINHHEFLNNGGTLKIPFEITAPNNFTLTNSTNSTQTIRINTGVLNSLNSVALVNYSMSGSVVTGSNNSITSYTLTCGTENYPRGTTINLNSPEAMYYASLMTTLYDQSTNYTSVDNKFFFLHNLKSSQISFASGIKTNTEIYLNITPSADMSGQRSIAILYYDAILTVASKSCGYSR